MKRTRRYFSGEFKREAVRQLLGGKRSLAVVAQELGIGAELLRRWREELNVPSAERLGLSEAEELRRLRRENAVLREEREILKKATAFFAKDAR